MCPYFKTYYKAMIINTGTKVGSRWWHKKTGLQLTSSRGHTIWNNSLWKRPENKQNSSSTTKDKKATIWVGEAETQSHQEPHRSIATHKTEGHIELLPKEQGVQALHQARQLLGPAPQRWVPKTGGFENQWRLHPGDPGLWETETLLFKGSHTDLHTPSASAEAAV